MDGRWRDGVPLSMQPFTWQPSKDGERLIGRILLNKRMHDGTVPADVASLLGLKVVGGKMTESGRLCAFITKVTRFWSGMVGFSREPRLMRSTTLSWTPKQNRRWSCWCPDLGSGAFDSQKIGLPISVTSPMSHSVLSGQVNSGIRRPLVPRIQVKLWYDKVGSQLIVTVLGAKALPVTDDGRPRNPYVQIYFLPDRIEKSKRRTKMVKKSVEPRWNQTYMYAPVHRHEFRDRMLELTVWDQARVQEEENQFLGEVLIDLDSALLDDQPHWYKLQLHGICSPYLQRRGLQPGETAPSRRLQSKGIYYNSAGSQRISDGEFSDYDGEDGIGVISDYRLNGRDSALSVPDRDMSSNHLSRSDVVRIRSRSPSQTPPLSGTPLYPLYREDAVRLLRGSKLSRAYSDAGQYSSLER
ncbi:regulating synaptic membrane exocytosis protein 2-like isoform X5 [Pseudoliparis swirei]|uniref:regulating synaptic membrane exocytosis protein 2-like isoform X5 n=1 Tax=Pseudoliparis swirei TaxID=2059687 RepID=UPI0024BEB53D|nr:regulating synaptic membrane exocytosis protein 2-like isoform X5 [Pseudoliparis swirei]